MRKIISLLSVLLCLSVMAIAQTRSVTGKVTDANGSPIPNVSVIIKGTSVGTATKADGTYSITVTTNAKTIVFSSVGSEPVEYSIGNKGIINTTLISSEKALSEVVVVGYGTQRKKELTGSVSNIRGNVLADKPVQSFDQALAGRAAGVQITVANGVVNSPPVFRIRGTNSISLSSYPLIVIDGVPAFTDNTVNTNTSAAANPLSSINPNDIESIDIAKDAASTAIYGSRAANGVVFVTTKKGRSGKAKVSYNGSVSWSNAYRLPKVLNAAQYLAFKPTAVANNPNFSSVIKYNSTNDANGNPIDTKWSDYVYRQGISQTHDVNVSGGSENTTYYFSVGYTDQKGIIKKNDFKRINTLFNIDSRLGKIITIGGKISYSNENNLSATSSGSLNGAAFNTGGLGRLSFVLPAIISPYNNDGSYNINGSAIGSAANITGISSLSYYNPVPILDLNYGNNENNHIQSNAYIQIKPVNWLTLRSTYGIDYLLVDNNSFQSPVTGDGYSSSGAAQSSLDKYKRWIWTNTAQADYTFGKKNNLSALVGNEQQRYTYSSYGLSRTTLSDLAYNVVQAGFTTTNTSNLNLSENYSLSTFGRINYNYDRKYLLSGNIRQDEYSALGIKKGIFWGASAGWEIAREEFWTSLGIDKVFSSFKLRGSYGKVGNVAGINDYSPYSTFNSGLYGGAASLNFSSVGNNQLKWETSKKTDLGFSFGLLKDRITAEFAYYKNDIDGLILGVQQAPSTGLPTNPLQNIGSMYNKGFEITLNATPILGKDFTWNTSLNVTFNKNEVTALAPGLKVVQFSTSGNETVSQSMPNYSLGYLWVIKTGGVDPSTGKRIFLNSANTPVYYQYYAPTGTYQYSTSPDGTTKYISPVTGGSAISQSADAVMYAPTQPKGYGGWNNTFKYKNFDVDILLTYQYGNYVYYGSNAGLHDQRWWNNATDILTDAWATTGDVNKKYARPVYSDNVSNGSSMPLDINVFKGDFIKLKNFSIGYNLPKRLVEKMKMGSFRFYLTGQNLGVITKYPGPDPEVSSNGNTSTGQGIDRNTSANARTILVGLNVGF